MRGGVGTRGGGEASEKPTPVGGQECLGGGGSKELGRLLERQAEGLEGVVRAGPPGLMARVGCAHPRPIPTPQRVWAEERRKTHAHQPRCLPPAAPAIRTVSSLARPATKKTLILLGRCPPPPKAQTTPEERQYIASVHSTGRHAGHLSPLFPRPPPPHLTRTQNNHLSNSADAIIPHPMARHRRHQKLARARCARSARRSCPTARPVSARTASTL